MESDNFSSISCHGFYNEAARYCWAAYLTLIILLSFIGDFIILLSSTKFKAFKLNGFLVALIQQIAISDIITSITNIPRAFSMMLEASLTQGYWPYIIIVIVPARRCLNAVNNLLTCAMITSKLIMVKFPDSRVARSLTFRSAHVLSLAIWAFSIFTVVPSAVQIIEKSAFFDTIKMACLIMLGENGEAKRFLHMVYFVVYFLIPNMIAISCTGYLVAYMIRLRRQSRLSGGSQRWQGILTAVVTTTVYSISTLPFAVDQLSSGSNQYHERRIARAILLS
jgi:hypothetical protein